MITRWTRITILLFAVLGGLYGFAGTFRALLRDDARGFGTFFFFICALLGFAFVTAAGILFWLDPCDRKPLIWAFSIQVPWVSLPGFVYKFAAGAYGMVALVATHSDGKYAAGITANTSLGSMFEIRILQNAPVQVGANIVALALLILLRRSVRQPIASQEGTVIGEVLS